MPSEVLLLATTNPGKIREIRIALAGLTASIVTLDDAGFAGLETPEETGATFAENAALKARYYAAATGLVTLAEDSGLAIDALEGRPGVASARYPGDTYVDKFAGLYRELSARARPWTARYICAIARVGAGELRGEWRATVVGEIAREPVDNRGFGYDPIFFFPPYGTTLADVTDAQKLAVSHRGRAFRAFREDFGHESD